MTFSIMKQTNSSTNKATTKLSEKIPNNKKGKENPSSNIRPNSMEAGILKLWASRKVFKIAEKTKELPTFVIREMPIPVDSLNGNTLKSKISQDIFLKYEIIHGNTVAYAPIWETFPFSIEVDIIKKDIHTSSRNIVNFRKQCRQLYSKQLKSQMNRLQKLGIFADWTTAEKTLEARYETKLFSFFDRMRDSRFLRDELKLSHWCPQCISPLEAGKTAKPITTNAQFTYVKFPLNSGFEEFGVEVYFAMGLPSSQLWEIAGTIAIGIYEKTQFYLIEWEDQYLIIAEPQLKNFFNQDVKKKKKTKTNKKQLLKFNACLLKDCTLSHPLYSLPDLHFFVIPEEIIDSISNSSEKQELMNGIVHLNPAHHVLSYNICNKLSEIRESIHTRFESSSSFTPIFDEVGRFTEEADTLCGINLNNAMQYITDELEARDCLIRTNKQEIEQLQCEHCDGLSVSRPYRHWVFSATSTDIVEEVTTSPEYWEHYNDNLRDEIKTQVLNISDMQISSQRQWGIPFPILRCDNCNHLITDKKILRAVRSSIRRGSEHWFRLSVEELLPTDTQCENCHSKDFRKESTYIESHFANLLQTLDISDFKKSSIDTTTNVVFAPRSAFLKWLGELSVLSASLQLSRPSKESHPFKHLNLNSFDDCNWDPEIEDKYLEEYPADVIRLFSVSTDLCQVPSEVDKTQTLQEIIDHTNKKYNKLRIVLDQVVAYKNNQNKKPDSNNDLFLSDLSNENAADTLSEHDILIITMTNQLLRDIQDVYKKRDFFMMWRMISDFCEIDLLVYIDLCQENDSDSANIVLPVIFKVILQYLAPILPFLAEQTYTKGYSASNSIFEEKLECLPQIFADEKSIEVWDLFRNKKSSK